MSADTPTFPMVKLRVAVRVSPPLSVKSAVTVKLYCSGILFKPDNCLRLADLGTKLMLKLPEASTLLFPDAIMASFK